MNQVVLFSSYFPPIQYFTKIVAYESILIDIHEHYQKQTFRNRCHIFGSNGTIQLTVPVQRDHREHLPIKDIRISYEYDWQRLHLKTLQTAYRSSAFFEYYEDRILRFFKEKTEYLLDLNNQILYTLLDLIKIDRNKINFTGSYRKNWGLDAEDLRTVIHPKPQKALPDLKFNPMPYFQVFSDKLGFQPNLSILDLLFNKGPQTMETLRNSIL